MKFKAPDPLTDEQLRRLHKRDLAQLRARYSHPYPCHHPEAVAAIQALVAELFRVRALAVHYARVSDVGSYIDRKYQRRIIGAIKQRTIRRRNSPALGGQKETT